MNVYEKLNQVQYELRVPKSQYNKFGDFYYRSCEDIMEAVKPLLHQVNAIILLNDDIVQAEGRYYIKATVSFIDCDSGEKIDNSALAREEETKKGMDASQLTGSTSSYARKYALNGLLGIDDSKDADKNKKINEEQYNTLVSELKRTGVGAKGTMKNYNVCDLHEMNFEQYADAISILKKKPTKLEPQPATPEQMEQNTPPNEIDCGLPFN